MATKLSLQYSLSRFPLMFLSLLTLLGVLYGCGVSSVALAQHSQASRLRPPLLPECSRARCAKSPCPQTSPPAISLPDQTATSGLPEIGSGVSPRKASFVSTHYHRTALLSESPTEPDGNLWFLEADKVGRITPEGTISEFQLPSRILAPTRVLRIPCVATSHPGRIMLSGLPNLVPPIRTARSGASPPQAQSAPSPCLILNLTRPLSRPIPTAISGLLAFVGTTSQGAQSGVSLRWERSAHLPLQACFLPLSRLDRMGTSGLPQLTWTA